MKRGLTTTIALGAAALTVLSGCEEHKQPPLERLKLVSRFFDSVRNRKFDEAASQGGKIYSLDRNNDFMPSLIAICESNIVLAEVQKKLQSGDVDEALRVLEEGQKKYPRNSKLRICHAQLVRFRDVTKELAAKMGKARGESATLPAAAGAEAGLQIGEFRQALQSGDPNQKYDFSSSNATEHKGIGDFPEAPKTKDKPRPVDDNKPKTRREGVSKKDGRESFERPEMKKAPETEQ